MRRLTVLAVFAIGLVVLAGVLLQAVALSKTGDWSKADLGPGFGTKQGEYAVYTGSGSVSSRGKSAQFTMEVTALSMDKDLRGGRRVGVFRDVQYSKGSEEAQWGASFARIAFSIRHISTPRSSFEESVMSMSLDLPFPPRWPVSLGETWESEFDTDTGMRAEVVWRVVGEENVSGLRCVRIDVTPKELLPHELTHPAGGDWFGVPGQKFVLTELSGRVWVEAKTGWIVKLERSLGVQEVSKGEVAAKGGRLSLLLTRRDKMIGTEYKTLSTQFDRLDYAQGFLTAMGWSGRHNVDADSDTGERMLSEFRKQWPKSAFQAEVAYLEKRFAAQRIYTVTNAKFMKPFVKLNGKPVPAFTGTYLDGNPFTTQSLQGKPAVILLLGGYNSDYVRYRAKAIESFARRWRGRGAVVVGVSGQNLDRSVAQGLAKELGGAVPIVVPKYTPRGPLSERLDYLYEIGTLLTVVVVDSKGIVRHYRGDLYPAEVEPLLKQMH